MATAVEEPQGNGALVETPQQPSSGYQNQIPQRIQVSSSKKPTHFYVNLSKKLMQQYGEVQLSALGQAVSVCVTVAEILKNSDLAVEKRVVTSLDSRPSDVPSRMHAKPKVEIYLDRSPRFEEVMARLDAERQARIAARQREEAQENAVPNGQM